jgi:hypothetical protein
LFDISGVNPNISHKPTPTDLCLTPPNASNIASILLKRSVKRIITTQARSQRILDRLQHPFIVMRHHLHKLLHHLIPISQNCDRFLTLGILGMFLDLKVWVLSRNLRYQIELKSYFLPRSRDRESTQVFNIGCSDSYPLPWIFFC